MEKRIQQHERFVNNYPRLNALYGIRDLPVVAFTNRRIPNKC